MLKFIGGAGLWFIALILPWGIWGEEAVTQPEIVLWMEPKHSHAFQPTSDNNHPTHFILQLQDVATGNLLSRPAQMELELVHLNGWGLLSTGFPHVEGKEQLKGTFHATQGRLAFDYLFPIRGHYRMTVRCRGMDSELAGNIEPIRQDFSISVAEQPENVRNARFFLLGLFLFGAGVGLVFARSSTARGGI